jgi:GT2 family glycosyltransferase
MATSGGTDEAPPSLGASVVTFAPEARMLQRTLESFAASAQQARTAGVLGQTVLTLIDNGPGEADLRCVAAAREALVARFPEIRCELRSGHGNVGYGAGHNLAIMRSTLDFHLVLNPDVLTDAGAMAAALHFMASQPRAVLVAPRVDDEAGRLQYLCKRYPTPLVLALRGFAPRMLRRAFAAALDRYEMHDVIGGSAVVADVPIASGAFMFCRTAALRAVGGFDPGFFLYFEDFDLSLRLAREGGLYYVPEVRVTHFGGHAARKGGTHIRMFAASALRFFRKHGWRRPELS